MTATSPSSFPVPADIAMSRVLGPIERLVRSYRGFFVEGASPPKPENAVLRVASVVWEDYWPDPDEVELVEG